MRKITQYTITLIDKENMEENSTNLCLNLSTV